MKVVRVLVVDDSAVARQMLADILTSDPEISVVGTACNGQEAIEAAQRLQPDLITMDVNMPVMDGLEATERIMAYCPTPILMVTAPENLHRDRDRVFQAIALGALDVMPKPAMGDEGDDGWQRQFVAKVKRLCQIRVITHIGGRKKPTPSPSVLHLPVPKPSRLPPGAVEVVAIAASTGGPGALRQILSHLPSGFPVSVIIVQHIASDFVAGLAEWLATSCKVKVRLAADGEPLSAGTAFIAAPGKQLTVTPQRTVQLSDPLPNARFCPSADVLFSSVASVFGKGSVGVILTGMGDDGVNGLSQLKQAGGYNIAQDESTSAVFGMPKVAIDRGLADEVLPVKAIGERLVKIASAEE